MEWVETTGRSVEEAKDAALDELSVDEGDAEFEVLTEPRAGLFGRLRSEARVRARVRPTAPPEKDDRRDRRRRRKVGETEAGADPTNEAGADPTNEAGADPTNEAGADPANEAGADPANEGRNSGPELSDGTPMDVAPSRQPRVGRSAKATAPQTDIPALDATGPVTPRERGGRRPPGSSPPSAPSRERTADGPRAVNGRRRARSSGGRIAGSNRSVERPTARESLSTNPEEAGQVEMALAEQGQVAQEFLRGLMRELGLAADIAAVQTGEDVLELNLQGEDLGALIGQKGTTLFALQDLTRTVVQRKTGASNGRLLVDVGGYRRKRHEALARFAEQVAEQVRTTGARKAMEPMNAADRKVVHDTLTETEGVTTLSEGEDPRRYVVVSPEA